MNLLTDLENETATPSRIASIVGSTCVCFPGKCISHVKDSFLAREESIVNYRRARFFPAKIFSHR